MLAIYNLDKNKITQTINKNYGVELKGNEKIQKLSPELLHKFKKAKEYELILNSDDEIADIKTIKSVEEYKQEQATLNRMKPSDNEVKIAERQINLINDLTELGVI